MTIFENSKGVFTWIASLPFSCLFNNYPQASEDVSFKNSCEIWLRVLYPLHFYYSYHFAIMGHGTALNVQKID